MSAGAETTDDVEAVRQAGLALERDGIRAIGLGYLVGMLTAVNGWPRPRALRAIVDAEAAGLVRMVPRPACLDHVQIR